MEITPKLLLEYGADPYGKEFKSFCSEFPQGCFVNSASSEKIMSMKLDGWLVSLLLSLETISLYDFKREKSYIRCFYPYYTIPIRKDMKKYMPIRQLFSGSERYEQYFKDACETFQKVFERGKLRVKQVYSRYRFHPGIEMIYYIPSQFPKYTLK